MAKINGLIAVGWRKHESPPAHIENKKLTRKKNKMNTTNSGIIEAAKDKSVAAIKGTGKIVETTVDAAAQIVTTTVKDTTKIGGEIGTAATGLAKGAIEDVKEIGVEAEHATAAVAGGAMKTVGEVGASAVDAVRETVTKPTNSDKAGPKQPEVMAASKN